MILSGMMISGESVSRELISCEAVSYETVSQEEGFLLYPSEITDSGEGLSCFKDLDEMA